MNSIKRATRIAPNDRREMILNAAIQLSLKIGYKSITRDKVAKIAKVSSALIAHYFPRMRHLRQAVIKAAISQNILQILAQGLILGDSDILKVPDVLKHKIAQHISHLRS